jgi:hypothetical protein
MTSFNVGVYYLLAPCRQWRRFSQFIVAFRLVTVVVFILAVKNGQASGSFIGVAIWELLEAFTKGVTLWYEASSKGNKKK